MPTVIQLVKADPAAKNQILQEAGSEAASQPKNFSRFSRVHLGDWVKAVSYTHLDVNKRQGKSTLLNMLAGLEKPTRGEIIIAGKHMERMNENQLVQFRRENVGFIFQSYNLLKTLNACLLYTSIPGCSSLRRH